MRSLFAILIVSAAYADSRLVSLKTVPAEVTLSGARAGQQFLAVAAYADGTERDVTAEAEWRVSNPALAKLAAGISGVHLLP